MLIGLALGGGLVLMLLAAILFTNALEALARVLGLGHAMTGSVLAAAGTAMPETVVPLVVVIAGGSAAGRTATGAILGAPLMLATLGFGVVGLVGILAHRGELEIPRQAHLRVLLAFSVSFVLLIVGALLPRPLRLVDAALLLCLYLLFVRRTLRSDLPLEGDPEPLLVSRLAPRLSRLSGASVGLPVVQALLGLGGLALASELFLYGLQRVAALADLSPLVLALLLVPIATELPEVTAGALWIRRGKDALAVGNVSGSMVFQATFPAVIGLCLTPWRLSPAGFLSALFTGVAVLVVALAAAEERLRAPVLAVSGLLLYLLYALLVLVLRV